MHVVLIYPYCLEERVHVDDVRVPPIGMYTIAAVLRENGIETTVLNWGHMKNRQRDMRNALDHLRPDVVGFSVLQANRWGAVHIARMAKALNPAVKVVFGGISATTMWDHFLRLFPEVDAVVVGEGERAFLQLVRFYENAEDGALPVDLPGVAYRRDGKAVAAIAAPPLEDLDTIPDPAHHFTYQHVLLGRGCPGNCTFCGSPDFWGRRVRFHSPRWFVDQLERLRQRGQRFFYFSDDTFTLQRDRVLAVCREMRERSLDIEWAAISRVDRIDEDMLRAMRLAGCTQISYGVESGSPDIRRLLGKPFSDTQIQEAFDITSRLGILTRAYFIYGCPGESDDTIARTLALMDRIKPLSAIFYILALFPGTRLYRDYVEASGANEDELWLQPTEDIMYFTTDPALSREQVLAWGRTLRGHFHQRLPAYIDAVDLADDPDLHTAHADFCSRLAMTLSHGEYAGIADIPGKTPLAQRLYQRSLDFAPNARAYLGLAIDQQKRGRHAEVIRLLGEAVETFPKDEALHTCLAISDMNLGNWERATAILERFDRAPNVLPHLITCYREMGNAAAANRCQQRLERLRTGG